MTGRALTSCPSHFGFPLPCALCKTGGAFPPEASSLRRISAHRAKAPTTATRSAFDVAAQERARLTKRDDADRALATFGRKPTKHGRTR